MRTVAAVSLILTLLIGAGPSCAKGRPPSPAISRGPVYLSLADSVAAAGDTLSATLHNASDTVLWHNACLLELERRDPAGSWAPAPVPPELPRPVINGRPVITVCTAHSESLAPGAAKPLPLVVPAGLPPGVYRFRFLWIPATPRSSRDGPRLLSPAFRIR
jgi:hypothetical protein